MNVQVKSSDLPPFKPLPMKPPSIETVRRDDGTVYLSSRHALGEMHRSVAHMFAKAVRGREQLGEGVALDLADALSTNSEVRRDLAKRPLRASESKPRTDHVALALIQTLQ